MSTTSYLILWPVLFYLIATKLISTAKGYAAIIEPMLLCFALVYHNNRFEPELPELSCSDIDYMIFDHNEHMSGELVVVGHVQLCAYAAALESPV